MAACVGGACAVDTCLAPWGDCNGLAADGCERDPSVDANNCGACGARCAQGQVCQAGACR